MTPQQINAAIATDLGWKFTEHPIQRFDPEWVNPRLFDPHWIDPDGSHVEECSDYSASLDAIRAAALERFRTPDERLNFSFHLSLLCRGGKQLWELTAADWCEAYLRAVGKWEDAK